jgi:hypothetical protein
MNRKSIVLVIVALVIAVITFLMVTVRYHRQWEDEFGTFTSIQKGDALNSEFSVLRVYKGHTYIRLTGGRQFVVSELRNSNYNPPSFYQLVSGCDAIIKDPGSDSIIIYSRTGHARFVFDVTGDIEAVRK